MRHRCFRLLTFFASGLAAALPAFAQGSFVNFESPVSKGLAATADRLFVANTRDNRLSVFDTTGGGAPVLLKEIQVGLEPVAVQARPLSPNEVWVVNHLSDDISVVDVALGVTIRSIPVGDEPADLIFTIDGAKAYVSSSRDNRIDVVSAATRTIVASYPVPMEEPRSLAITPNGKFVTFAVFESGNRTTILDAANAPPSNPQVGLVIADSHPSSPVILPDKDVFAINTRNERLIGRAVKGVGTTLFSVSVHPSNGRLYVANTEARNLVAGEPSVRGHVIDSRVTTIQKVGRNIVVTPIDLNPTVDYEILPNPAAVAVALSQPTAVAFHPSGSKVYVAAFGSAKVAVMQPGGAILSRIDVGLGPRALVATATRLYVLNHLDATVSEVDLATDGVVRTFPIAPVDPRPAEVTSGQIFLYDARESGNGTLSCASCHIDGHTDQIAWDLGVPGDFSDPDFPGPKGPMMTQSLRGLKGTEPFHWRGDRANFQAFANARASLMGADEPFQAEPMDRFAEFAMTLAHPPNPHQPRDRSFGQNASFGLTLFTLSPLFGSGQLCVSCHALPGGTGPDIVSPEELFLSQRFNTAILAGINEKTGFARVGFGFGPDGSFDTVSSFLSRTPPFSFLTSMQKDQLSTLLDEFDTGQAPSIGLRVTIDLASAGDPASTDVVTALVAEAGKANADVVAVGSIDSAVRSLWFDARAGSFAIGRPGEGPYTAAQLVSLAASGRAVLTFIGVPLGSGPRIGIDRDDDALPDGEEAALGTSAFDPDSDDDGVPDGIEVARGSDPLDDLSVPGALSSPSISTLSPRAADPWGLDQFVVTGSGLELGAVLVVSDAGSVVTEYPIFPVDSTSWSTHYSGAYGAEPLDVSVRNRDGGTSSPVVYP
jgi:YVTN family beta-propeller protein